jgi:hypothetical protein
VSTSTSTMSPCTEDATLERVRFFPRQMIAADDLNQEQTYHRQRLRNHNRFLHGWGVVCGCDVRAAGDDKKPWQVRICPGYILTPQGDEVYVSTEALFDVATCITQSSDPCAFSRPCPPVTLRAKATQTLYLAVRHVECQSRPVRVAPSGCTCDDVDCEYSRIRDGYEFCCLSTLPSSHEETPPSCEELCRPTGIFACPSCPDDGWVVLATLTLPELSTTQLTEVDPLANRRLLYSAFLIQRLGLCGCRTT